MSMAASLGATGRNEDQGVTRVIVLMVLAVTFALRLLQLRSAQSAH
jgi:hypothetical protein